MEIETLEKKIGYNFKNREYLHRALSHSSYVNERHNNEESNERLEFLGDSVLGIITADYYFHNFSLPEGELTKLRASTVCEKTLSSFADQIELGKYLKLGKGEERTGGRQRPSINADAFEAVIAAIYLDGGIEEARKFVLRFVERLSEKHGSFKDYKTTLQEIIQKNPEETLEYIVVDESGPDHDKSFEVEVHLNSNVIGRGKGKSKKNAEQEAAREALELMGI
ncbi:MAG: ribonuclease III [Clostridia bacterium]|nr:ribonuclease III [Clostridia bacterium]